MCVPLFTKQHKLVPAKGRDDLQLGSTPCISSPNHHLLAAHAHTIEACSVVIYTYYLISLLASYLEICLLA